jgi:hypothetical protein
MGFAKIVLFLLFYCLLSKFFFFFSRPFSLFFLSILLSFLLLSNWFLFFIVLRFRSSFSTLFYSCFFGSCGFISSLPQLAWD